MNIKKLWSFQKKLLISQWILAK